MAPEICVLEHGRRREGTEAFALLLLMVMDRWVAGDRWVSAGSGRGSGRHHSTNSGSRNRRSSDDRLLQLLLLYRLLLLLLVRAVVGAGWTDLLAQSGATVAEPNLFIENYVNFAIK